jgi:hypothetical protein
VADKPAVKSRSSMPASGSVASAVLRRELG